jgi:hypothetical protein
VASLAFSATAVQPGIGRTDTDANGVSLGRFTSSLVVAAVSLSVGTLNVTVA